jgi:hypothetical protein
MSPRSKPRHLIFNRVMAGLDPAIQASNLCAKYRFVGAWMHGQTGAWRSPLNASKR